MHAKADGDIHETVGQGRWFPREARELGAVVDCSMAEAAVPPLSGRLVGIIAPHAGYAYSGGVAGHAYRALQDCTRVRPPDLVILLGFSHRELYPGLALLDGGGWRSPLGTTDLDRASGEALVAAGQGAIAWNAAPHRGEHSAENQLPFLQRAAPGVPLVAGLFGEHSAETLDAVASALAGLAERKRLVVIASTDLLHDPDYAKVIRTDTETLRAMAALDAPALNRAWQPRHQVCCGIGPVLTLLDHARRAGCGTGTVLAYRNSGDDHPETRGQWVVGYGALAFNVPAAGYTSAEAYSCH